MICRQDAVENGYDGSLKESYWYKEAAKADYLIFTTGILQVSLANAFGKV